MTMKWNADADRMLLVKLIETHQIAINYEAIRAAWPDDAPVTPTARAIQERFNRIRKIIGVGGTSAGRRAPTTPRRGRARAPRTPTAAAASRKRKGQKSVSDSSDTEENISAGGYGPSPTKVAKTSASDDGIVESPVSGRQAGPRAGVPVLGSPIKLKKLNTPFTPDMSAHARPRSMMSVDMDDPFLNREFEKCLAESKAIAEDIRRDMNSSMPNANYPYGSNWETTGSFGANRSTSSYGYNGGMQSFQNTYNGGVDKNMDSVGNLPTMPPGMTHYEGNGKILGYIAPGGLQVNPYQTHLFPQEFLNTLRPIQPGVPQSMIYRKDGYARIDDNTPVHERISPLYAAMDARFQSQSRPSASVTPTRPQATQQVKTPETAIRVRPSRRAGQQAAQGMSAVIKQQQEMAKADGEKSSDSSGSVFTAGDMDAEGDYI